MFSVRCRRLMRRGMSNLQTALLLVVVAVAVIASVRVLGRSTRSGLNETASNVADPASLVDRWGSCSDQQTCPALPQ